MLFEDSSHHPMEANESARSAFTTLRFRWPWRPYQARILKALEAHLDDDRIHVVAAPGSGKTVLGLEIIRRLGRPAVILSPTRTVRDQWISRLADFHADPDAGTPAWASTSLERPGHLTSITYQALHTRHRASLEANIDDDAEDPPDQPPSHQEVADVVALLCTLGTGVIVLDEAHHLRKAWWQALSRIIDGLEGLRVVSLTATPPYDAVGAEWVRYESLCGPIDEEISVPELVRSGTLCPHQDYVWAVRPTPQETSTLRDYQEAVTAATADLLHAAPLLEAVQQHPWTVQPEAEAVFEEPEAAAALLVFLKAHERPLPKPLLELLGSVEADIPPIDQRWWQVLIKHYLWGKTWSESHERETHRDHLASALCKQGLLWRRELRLQESRPVTTLLTMSAAKLDACVDIYELERHVRGEQLRQVILCDYIRESDRSRLGAFPVFGRLVAHVAPETALRLAVLTGRLAIVHTSHIPRLQAWAEAQGADIGAEPLTGHRDFCRLTVQGRQKSTVTLLTRLLKTGAVHVLVGTRALLGEGWDAPVVNSLVLASYVGSFVTTNQMRGRAIRRDPNDPAKAASVWHLVAVDAQTDPGLADWSGLERRFRAFVGLSADVPTIESGLRRLRLPQPRTNGLLKQINEISAERLSQIDSVGERWREAIAVGTHGYVVPSVQIKRAPRRPRYFFWATLRYLLFAAAGAAYWVFFTILDLAADLRIAFDEPLFVLGIAATLAVIVATPPLVRAGRAWLRALPVDGVVRQVALAVFEALVDAGVIESDLDVSTVDVHEIAPGVHTTALQGGTFYEQSVFADAVDEVLGPITSPRYLITRTDRRGSKRADIHAVPTLLALNKEKAQCFLERWTQRMGPAQLIYTRTAEGRAALLRARSRTFSSTFVPATERMDRWQ